MSRIDDIRPGALFGGRMLREIFESEHVELTSGDGIVSSQQGAVLTVDTAPAHRFLAQQIWAQLGTSVRDAPNWRWFYNWDQVVPTDADSWEIMSAGLNSSSGYGQARNGIEAPNGTGGQTGCGINIDTLPPGFELQPIGIGAVVLMSLPTIKDGTTRFPQFQATNQVDGECSLDAGAYPSRTITVDTVLDLSDTIVEVDASAGDVRVELPLASSVPSGAKLVTVKKVDSTTSVVTVVGNAADVGGIDGLTAYDLTFDGDSVSLLSSSSSWIIQ